MTTDNVEPHRGDPGAQLVLEGWPSGGADAGTTEVAECTPPDYAPGTEPYHGALDGGE